MRSFFFAVEHGGMRPRAFRARFRLRFGFFFLVFVLGFGLVGGGRGGGALGVGRGSKVVGSMLLSSIRQRKNTMSSRARSCFSFVCLVFFFFTPATHFPPHDVVSIPHSAGWAVGCSSLVSIARNFGFLI